MKIYIKLVIKIIFFLIISVSNISYALNSPSQVAVEYIKALWSGNQAKASSFISKKTSLKISKLVRQGLTMKPNNFSFTEKRFCDLTKSRSIYKVRGAEIYTSFAIKAFESLGLLKVMREYLAQGKIKLSVDGSNIKDSLAYVIVRNTGPSGIGYELVTLLKEKQGWRVVLDDKFKSLLGLSTNKLGQLVIDKIKRGVYPGSYVAGLLGTECLNRFTGKANISSLSRKYVKILQPIIQRKWKKFVARQGIKFRSSTTLDFGQPILMTIHKSGKVVWIKNDEFQRKSVNDSYKKFRSFLVRLPIPPRGIENIFGMLYVKIVLH